MPRVASPLRRRRAEGGQQTPWDPPLARSPVDTARVTMGCCDSKPKARYEVREGAETSAATGRRAAETSSKGPKQRKQWPDGIDRHFNFKENIDSEWIIRPDILGRGAFGGALGPPPPHNLPVGSFLRPHGLLWRPPGESLQRPIPARLSPSLVLTSGALFPLPSPLPPQLLRDP